ncbi:MAG: YDG domain-containing protein [Isosphaeraceae bacterium]
MYTSIFKSRSRRQSQQQRNKRRFNLACESLEGRQLLSASALPAIGAISDILTYGTTLGSAINPTTVQDANGHAVAGTFDFKNGLTDVTDSVLDVGHYGLSVTFNPTDTTDYSSATTTASIDITQAKIVIVADSPANITYGNSSPTLTNTLYTDLGPDSSLGKEKYLELDSTDLASVAYTSALGSAPAATITDTTLSAGDHTINPTDISTLSPTTDARSEFLNNFDVVYGTGTLTVDRKALTATITAADKTYDGNTTAATQITLGSGVVGSEDVSVVDGTGNFASKDHGTWTVTDSGITLAGADAGNYTVNDTATTTATINTVSLTATITAADKTYDGNTTAVDHATLGSGVISGEDVSLVDGTATFASKNVGAQTVTDTGLSLTGADSGNYTVNPTASTTASITPATLIVTANNTTMVLGGPVPTFSAYYIGLVNGDTVSSLNLNLSFTPSSTTVSGTITPSGNATSTNSDYTIVYDPGTLTVNTTTKPIIIGLPPSKKLS